VSLPLYVNLPYHYASVAGARWRDWAPCCWPRAFDALVDPAIGRQADRLLRRGMHRRCGAWPAC
jgi:hypothetical protein